jgi:hypothetical protein
MQQQVQQKEHAFAGLLTDSVDCSNSISCCGITAATTHASLSERQDAELLYQRH